MLNNKLIKLTAGLAILPCLYIAWLALSWGLADRYAFDAAKFLKAWQGGKELTTVDLEAALTQTRKAINWAPDHPDYRDQMAQLLLITYQVSKNRDHIEEARNHLLHSRSVRPYWPKNWAAYTELKQYLGEVDADMQAALRAATQYGPWEARVLQIVTKIGVANFSSLDAETQQAVMGNIKRGLESPVRGVPRRIASHIEEGVSGWTLGFTTALLVHLSETDWQRRSFDVKTDLALLLWPLSTKSQQEKLTVQIVTAITNGGGNRLLKKVTDSGQLLQICPRLPREQRYRNLCNNNKTIKQQARR